jgi:DNA polymerase-3 subunit alpha (Gram-positive type)
VQIAQEVENVIRHAKLNSKNEEPAQFEEAGTAEKKAEKKTDKGQQEKKDKKAAFADRKDNRKGDFRGGFRRDSNPDVIYGRDFEGEPVALETITGEMGEVIVRGQVMEVEAREIRNEKTILIFPITDFTDSIVVKMFLRNEQVPEVTEHVKKGAFLKFRGVTTVDRFDSELTIASIAGIKKIANFTTARVDTSPQKRVELHCHTKMSDMDGVTDAKSLVKRAYEWGHPAIAITDHIEYRPHKKDIDAKLGRSFEIAEQATKEADVLVIRGSEITRSMPPGHFNAIFLNDSNPLEQK